MNIRRSRRTAGALAGLCVLSAVGLSLAAVPGASGASQAGSALRATHLSANLNGAKEVPGPGDSNGTGHADVTLLPARHKVCVDATWHRIGTPVAAHIHRGARGVAGPVVVDLTSAVTGGSHCARHVPIKTIRRIKNHPASWYFNIHTGAFPGGAIRGQLHR